MNSKPSGPNSNSKPMTYPAMKSIMMFLKPGTRMAVATRCPSVRTAEKSVPLHTKYMSIEPSRIVMDDEELKIECVQQDPLVVSIKQSEFMSRDAKNGVSFDLDKFGMKDFSAYDKTTLGDVFIEVSEERQTYDIDEMIEEHRQEFERIRRKKRFQPTATTSLRFTWTSPRGTHTEILKYNKKMPEAMKYLTTKLFGRTNLPVQVQLLHFPEGGTLRLPPNLKIFTEGIILETHIAYLAESLKGLLHESSFPFLLVAIINGHLFNEPENYGHQWIREAEHLHIWCAPDADWEDPIVNSDRLKVTYNYLGSSEELMDIMEKWMKEYRPIGTDHKYQVRSVETTQYVLESMENVPGAVVERLGTKGCKLFPDTVIIPLNAISELCVFSLCDNDDFIKGHPDFECEPKFELSLIVTPIHHRDLWNIDFYNVFD